MSFVVRGDSFSRFDVGNANPIDDGIKAGSDTNLSIICRVVAMTGNALNMRKIIRFVLPLFLSVAFVVKIARGEYRDKRKSYFRFDYAEPYSTFVVTKIVKGERRDVKNGCFSLLSSCILSCVYRRKDKPKEKAILFTWRFCFHLGEIVWERLPKSNYLFTFVENIKIDIM